MKRKRLIAVLIVLSAIRVLGVANMTSHYTAYGSVTRHIWKTVRLGKIRPDGQFDFDIVWTSGKPVKPVPYPNTGSRYERERFLAGLYTQRGHAPANPGTGGGGT